MKIIQWPDVALATPCEPIEEFGPELGKLLDDMWETLEAVKDVEAMGLAANQVGVLKRVFIMKDLTGVKIECINPEWSPIESGSGWANEVEGCLSTPGLFSQVHGRHKKIWLKMENRRGQPGAMQVEGIDAVCVQHETDHLNGIFWFDRMKRNPRRTILRQWKKKVGYEVPKY